MADSAHHRRGLIVAFGSTFFELVGMFMLMPLLQLNLTARGISAAGVGSFTALEWIGVFIATPFAGRIARSIGTRATFWWSAILPLGCAIGFACTQSFVAWGVLFFIAGTASGLRWIIGEALVAEYAPAARRGRIVGLFQTMIGVTFMIGPGLLALTGAQGVLPFMVVIVLMTCAVLCSLWLPRVSGKASAAREPLSALAGMRDAIVGAPAIMAAGFVGGVFELGMTGLLPVLGIAVGFDARAAALLVAVSGIGSALLMLPAGELADRVDRHRVSMATASVLLASTALLPWVHRYPALLWPLVVVWGGAGGALYTLAMVHVGMQFRGPALVNHAAVLVMAYTLGGVIAPPIGGFALEYAPRLGFTAVFASIATLGIGMMLATRRRTHAASQSRP